MSKAVIFDFDGVIVDSETLKFKAIQQAAQKENITIEDTTFLTFIGKKRAFFLREEVSDITEEQIENIMHTITTEEMNPKSYQVIEGLQELLEYFKNQKCKIAIGTGSKKPFVEAILKEKKLEHYFSVLITGELFTSSKPSRECFKKALKTLNTLPEDCLVVEDSVVGIHAAKKLGILTYGLTTYHDEKTLAEADKCFLNHEEILEFLKQQS